MEVGTAFPASAGASELESALVYQITVLVVVVTPLGNQDTGLAVRTSSTASDRSMTGVSVYATGNPTGPNSCDGEAAQSRNVHQR